MVFIVPQLAKSFHSTASSGHTQVSDSAQRLFLAILFAILGSTLVVLPLIWGLFYSSSNVKATGEAHDPVARWTDHSPAPVLAVSFWAGCAALSALMLSLRRSFLRAAPRRTCANSLPSLPSSRMGLLRMDSLSSRPLRLVGGGHRGNSLSGFQRDYLLAIRHQ